MFALHEAKQLLPGMLLLNDTVTDIGAVETADKNPRLFQRQARDDFLAGFFIGGGRQGNARNGGIAFMEPR